MRTQIVYGVNMKIKISTILRIWLLIYIGFNSNILQAFGIDMPSYFDVLTVIFFTFLALIPMIRKKVNRYTYIIDRLLIYYAIFLVIEALWTMQYYQLSGSYIYYMIRCNLFLLYPFMVYPVLYIVVSDGYIERILNELLGIAVIGNGLRLISYFAYDKLGVSVFTVYVDIFKSAIRNGRYRLGATMMHAIGFDVSLHRVAEYKKNQFLYAVLIAYFVFFQFYCSMGRTQEICYLLTLFVFLYCIFPEGKKNSGKVRSVLLLGITLSFGYLIIGDFFPNLLSTFTSENSDKVGSTIARMYGLNYYWRLMKDHLLTGIGLLFDDSMLSGSLIRIMRGTSTAYSEIAYFEDLGIIGQFFNYGILGMIFFLGLFFHWYLIVRKVKKSRNTYYYSMLLLLLVHGFAQTLTSMSLFQSNKMLQIPILMAIFEFARVQAIPQEDM